MKLKSVLFIVFIGFLFTNCSNEQKEKEERSEIEENSTELVEKKDQVATAQKIFYMVSSPLEMASMLQKAGAEYQSEYLNDVNNLKRYETTRQKALNLGVYATDLSYASIFDQTQESMFFVSNCKKLADALGISEAFNDDVMERIEVNLNDKDSMLYVISDVYWLADGYLKENERSDISTLMIAGGWLEGLYISSQVVKNTNNKTVKERLADQKYSIEHVISLLEFHEEDEDFTDILVDFRALQKLFDAIEAEKQDIKTSVNKETGVTTVGSNKKVKISDNQINLIIKKVETIRNKFIQ